MSNDFVFEDSDDYPVWEHDERLASTPSSGALYTLGTLGLDAILVTVHASSTA